MQFEILKKQTTLAHEVTQKELDRPFANSMALHTGEEKESIIDNRKHLLDKMCSLQRLYTLNQVHGCEVYVVSKETQWSENSVQIDADAHITDVRGVALGVLTADCVPILLYAKSKCVVGAVHAGWKGIRDNILKNTIDKMAHEYGVEPSDIIACIGPAIGGCCYEVGADVADWFDSCKELAGDEGKYMLDLKSINKSQLLDAGVLEENIEISDICTACQKENFFSYRAESGCSGRFMSVIGLKG